MLSIREKIETVKFLNISGGHRPIHWKKIVKFFPNLQVLIVDMCPELTKNELKDLFGKLPTLKYVHFLDTAEGSMQPQIKEPFEWM